MSSDHGDFSKEALFKQDGENIVVIIDGSEGKAQLKTIRSNGQSYSTQKWVIWTPLFQEKLKMTPWKAKSKL